MTSTMNFISNISVEFEQSNGWTVNMITGLSAIQLTPTESKIHCFAFHLGVFFQLHKNPAVRLLTSTWTLSMASGKNLFNNGTET